MNTGPWGRRGGQGGSPIPSEQEPLLLAGRLGVPFLVAPLCGLRPAKEGAEGQSLCSGTPPRSPFGHERAVSLSPGPPRRQITGRGGRGRPSGRLELR